MIKKYSLLLLVSFLVSSTMQSQVLKNLQGQYECEENGFFHLYEFNKRKIIVTLNHKNPFVIKHTIFYTSYKTKKQDSVYVNKFKHETERLKPQNDKDDIVNFLYNSSNDDYSSLWVLEKVEGEKVYITIIPGKHTYFSGWKSEEDSNLNRHIILTPIAN